VYLAIKAIHVFAVVMFLGNITVGLFWKRYGDRTGNAAIMAHTVRGIILADRLITVPSILVIVVAGVAAAAAAGIPILATGWIVWSLGLFILSGMAFMPLSRVQRALYQVATTGLQTQDQKTRYDALSRQWDIWGSIALILPIVALILMVVKPALPAFHA
jgi:uncharacterized membrane protein